MEHDELIAAYAEAWNAENTEKWAEMYHGKSPEEINRRIAFAISRAFELGRQVEARFAPDVLF